MTDLIVQEKITRDKIRDYFKITGIHKDLNLSEKEMLTFMEICSLFNLNPFKRDAHLVAYGQGQYREFSIITGYEVYIRRALESGLLIGWHASMQGSIKDNDLRGVCEIERKDMSKFAWTVDFNEVCKKRKDGSVTKFWAEMPNMMAKKVAISQAFRLCFNDVIGGMPYTAEEISPAEEIKNITPIADPVKEPLEDQKNESKEDIPTPLENINTQIDTMQQKENGKKPITRSRKKPETTPLNPDKPDQSISPQPEKKEYKFPGWFGKALGGKSFDEIEKQMTGVVQKYYDWGRLYKGNRSKDELDELKGFLKNAEEYLNILIPAN